MEREEILTLFKKQKELLKVKIEKEEKILNYIKKKISHDKKRLDFANRCIGYLENFSFEVAKKKIRELAGKYPELVRKHNILCCIKKKLSVR